MKPVDFDESNQALLPPTTRGFSTNVKSIDLLRVWTDGEQCVSCWKMTWRERLAALVFGRVWCAVLTMSRTQPAVYLEASRSYFKSSKNQS